MSPRIVFIIFFVIALIISLLTTIVNENLGGLGDLGEWITVTTVLNVIVAIGGLSLAYWVYVDGERLDKLEQEN